MPQPLSDYFASEAGEFLDQMDALLAGSERPDPVRFFRLARGVRGSAQLAGAEAVAGVAERLEDGARALRDGVLAWTDEVRDRARATAQDLRALVSTHGREGAADASLASAAAARWADIRGGRRRSDHPEGGDELFAFVRREIGGVVAEMDRVLAELSAQPGMREPLRTVLRRMRPVRGVAGMGALSPVLELLEGIEDAAHEVLSRASDVQPAELELLGAGRDALRAAGTSLEDGRAPGESPELSAFRALRDRADEAAGDADVVPISRLFADGGQVHVVSSPLAPVPSDGGTTPEVEAFLRMEATGFLDRAEGLLGAAPGAPRRWGRTVRDAAELAAGVRELAAAYGAGALAAAADVAANAVRGAGSPEEAREALVRLRHALPGAAPESAPAPPASGEAPASTSPDAPAAGAEETEEDAGVVAVESLLYAPEDALREALALRPRIESLAGGGADAALRDALDELFGLVEQGMAGRA